MHENMVISPLVFTIHFDIEFEFELSFTWSSMINNFYVLSRCNCQLKGAVEEKSTEIVPDTEIYSKI